MMTQPIATNVTAEAFIAWAPAQPQGSFELVQGEVVAMSPERAGNARAKLNIVGNVSA